MLAFERYFREDGVRYWMVAYLNDVRALLVYMMRVQPMGNMVLVVEEGGLILTDRPFPWMTFRVRRVLYPVCHRALPPVGF